MQIAMPMIEMIPRVSPNSTCVSMTTSGGTASKTWQATTIVSSAAWFPRSRVGRYIKNADLPYRLVVSIS
ncbi:MAG: hypothetical protein GY820_37955 [Gammaproteobacteria bacterium]|nr:hypothetical protein [Gammaproteobacteria bacterium]